MKYQVTRFRNLQVALKELQPFVKDGEHLQTGKPFKKFGGLRSRELLANWLLCAVGNFVTGDDRMTFSSDPLGGDGIINDAVTGKGWPTEHVLVPAIRNAGLADVEELIVKIIERKQNKGGAAYASGKMLVVFLNAGGGVWLPNRVAHALPKNLDFEAVWVVGLQGLEDGARYVYAVTRLDVSQGNAPVWRVRITEGFDGWDVEPIQ